MGAAALIGWKCRALPLAVGEVTGGDAGGVSTTIPMEEFRLLLLLLLLMLLLEIRGTTSGVTLSGGVVRRGGVTPSNEDNAGFRLFPLGVEVSLSAASSFPPGKRSGGEGL